jgi:D-3-phosphoglycerate dehydrogenase / 2-oxoglutarate reductase
MALNEGFLTISFSEYYSRMAIIFFDFDSTVVKKETLDDAIATALSAHPERDQLVKEVEEITRLGMEGKLDFVDSVRRRLAVVPLTKDILIDRGEAMKEEITEGMRELFEWLRTRGQDTHIVSGGFEEYIAPVARELYISPDHTHTNRFTFDEAGIVDGIDENSLLWTNEGKAPALRALRKKFPDETFVMIGDGANDLKAFESGAADHFIGFGGNVVRESVKMKAPLFAHSSEEIRKLLEDILS